MSPSSDAALLQEIQRLSGAIDRHKYAETKPPDAPRFPNRNAYVNPAIANRKYVNPAVANKKYVNPALSSKSTMRYNERSPSGGQPLSSATRELVINGVAFESSRSKLTRKDLTNNKSEASTSARPEATAVASSTSTLRPQPLYVRRGGNLVTSTRIHKPTFSKRKRLAGRNNMVLDNIKGTRTGHVPKRRKVDKQCRFFTMTGTCQRGLTCPYQHDPEKIAICSQFLTNSCPNNAETCNLSHEPTPARVPLCHHFANHGRCTRENCPYPHVRVGTRHGVCRDFAVVGYCEKGIDCDQQHVRECPDFAEKGVCPNATCKLPHVIRANRQRQVTTSTSQAQSQPKATRNTSGLSSHQSSAIAPTKDECNFTPSSAVLPTVNSAEAAASGTAEDYISLMFEESDEEDEDEVEVEEDEDEEDEDEEDDNSETPLENNDSAELLF